MRRSDKPCQKPESLNNAKAHIAEVLQTDLKNKIKTTKQTKVAHNKISLAGLFWVFAKIGAFTIGGGYAMIPLIQNELIKRGWMESDELTDIIAIAQSAPGVMAVNVAIFTGYKLRGNAGCIAATLGSVMPAFIIILAVAAALKNFKDNPAVISVFAGIRPVVTALMAGTVIRLLRRGGGKPLQLAIAALSCILVAFVNVSPIYILLCLIIIALIVNKLQKTRSQ